MSGKIDLILQRWQKDPSISENIAVWSTREATTGQFIDFPGDMDSCIVDGLRQQGIQQIYSHQAAAWECYRDNQHMVIVSGTASGKTLCYTLPVLQTILEQNTAKALFLFPTKALGADQYDSFLEWAHYFSSRHCALLKPAMYDGDTPSSARLQIRKTANLVITNPDMLHLGILPHHTQWEEFFRNLRFVIIDEMHTYRGVFGSHVANVVRRLKRIASFYEAQPQFIMTSATVANPLEHGKRLIDESSVRLIDEDGAPHGVKNFIFYNPPIINADLGIRAGASGEAIHLTGDLFRGRAQSIVFSGTRRGVEMILRRMKQMYGDTLGEFRAYRSGYLPEDRREIEANLRSGQTRVVVATSALELGIDIGGLDAALLVGYPGTISATLQQTGRAGRGMNTSCAVFIASANPLDQYLIQHPDYFFGKNPERVLIDPDNLLILLKHLQCALFEYPLKQGEKFGSVNMEILEGLIEALVESGVIHAGKDRYFWMADEYPASRISLRSTSESTILLQIEEEGRPQTIGEVDELSSYWMVHPQAVYLHGGESYFVEELDLQKKVARLSRFWGDYYTDPVKDVALEKLGEPRSRLCEGAIIHYGDVMVTTQVVGFRRMHWENKNMIDVNDQLMPANQLRTTAYWLEFPDDVVDPIRGAGLWKNDNNNYGPTWPAIRKLVLRRDENRCQHCGVLEGRQPLEVHHKIPFRNFSSPEQANRVDNLVTLCPACHREAEKNIKMRSGLAGLQYVLHNLAPLQVMCDMGDLDSTHDAQSTLADNHPVVVIYELIPAGIGLCETLYEQHEALIAQAYELVVKCTCRDGCPSCVGAAGENGIGGKKETLALLSVLMGLGL